MARGKKKEELTLEEKLEQALVPVEEQPYEVPENWCWTIWGMIGEFVVGNGFKKEYQGFTGYEIPFYKVGSLKYADNFGYLYDESNTITEEIRRKLKAILIPRNSILFAKIGEAIRLNRRCLNKKECCIDNNTMAFLTNSCNFKYVYYWTLGQEFYDLTNATTVPAIRKSDLELIKIPLPPLAEQQRIVERIENLFFKLDEVEERITEVKETYLAHRATILSLAFKGKLTSEWRIQNNIRNNWLKKTFNDVAVIKSNLVQPSEYQNFPHIAPDNIEKRTGVLLHYNTIAEDKVTSGKHRFYPGQILYSKIRPYLSKVVMVDFDGLCSADMYPIEAKENTRYLWYYMLSDDFLEQAASAGSRSVLPKINQKELSKLYVNIPDIDEQEEVVKILDKILPYEQKVAEDLSNVLEQIDVMKKSILAKAFRGKLGTNNPDEESAIELLKALLMKS